jgi:hypothetical protein
VLHFTEEIQGEKVTVVFTDGAKVEGRILTYTDERLKIATDTAVLEFASDSVWLVANQDGDLILPLEKKASILPWILAGGGCVALGVLAAVGIATVALMYFTMAVISGGN